MEMVAASKMRRAQQATLASRAYADKSRQVLAHLASQPGQAWLLHPLLEERAEKKSLLLILMTSDRGLCGAFNVNIIRAAFDFMRNHDNQPIRLLTIGKRGRDAMARAGKNIIAEFTGMSERPTALSITPVTKIALEEFTTHVVDEVYLAYTDFVNVLRQRPTVTRLLPLRPLEEIPTEKTSALYLYEPNPKEILDAVLPRLTELQIYQALLESVASEHSARMVAMRNATDAAHELIGELTLEMNKARQWNITKEMLDIAGGAEALRKSLQT